MAGAAKRLGRARVSSGLRSTARSPPRASPSDVAVTRGELRGYVFRVCPFARFARAPLGAGRRGPEVVRTADAPRAAGPFGPTGPDLRGGRDVSHWCVAEIRDCSAEPSGAASA